jgi:hypothetical protein
MSTVDISVFTLLSVETHRRAATDNTRSREASGAAGGPRSLDQRPRIWHTTWCLSLLGVPPDLVPDQEGVNVLPVSFLHAQTHLNVNPGHDRLIGCVYLNKVHISDTNINLLCNQ